MQLHQVPRNTYIRVLGDTKFPPGGSTAEQSEILKFIKLDGMYSLCKNAAGETVHLVAWADVEIVSDETVSDEATEVVSA